VLHSGRLFSDWHEAEVPAACAIFRSLGKSGCANSCSSFVSHAPNRTSSSRNDNMNRGAAR
jgi:hypothetical protein